MFLTSAAYAMGSSPQGTDAQLGLLQSPFIPMIVIFVIMYFLTIRPQQKKAKAHKDMLAALKAGDVVMTAGGIFGRIVKIDESKAILNLGDSTLTVSRAYISEVCGATKQAPSDKKKGAKQAKGKTTDTAPENSTKAKETTVAEDSKATEEK